jgi:hypothetical protein
MATAPKFRIDVDIHNLLMNSAPGPARVPERKGSHLAGTGISAISS